MNGSVGLRVLRCRCAPNRLRVCAGIRADFPLRSERLRLSVARWESGRFALDRLLRTLVSWPAESRAAGTCTAPPPTPETSEVPPGASA